MRRIAAAFVTLLACGALATGVVPGVSAIFTAETKNPNATASGGWIPAPSGLSDTVGGGSNDQRQLSWTSGASASSPSPNPVTGQQILRANGATGNSASCGSYSPLTTLAAGATAYADSSGAVADWWCYQVVSTSSGSWTSSATFTPVRLLVATQAVIANGGSGSSRVNSGDTVTITFNQSIATPAANSLCEINNGSSDVILLGDPRTSGTCATSDSYTIGALTGGSISSTHELTQSVSVSGNVLTVTITQNSTSTASGPWTFTPSSTLASSAGSTPACTASACQTAASGGF